MMRLFFFASRRARFFLTRSPLYRLDEVPSVWRSASLVLFFLFLSQFLVRLCGCGVRLFLTVAFFSSPLLKLSTLRVKVARPFPGDLFLFCDHTWDLLRIPR